ncbi:hypothetical protein QFC21_004234 [Naganishia friedmannii]|uniref:Uncharacterized protein n=1 Tax=Naganishia friedmannii TaxID=89922 RepID=A0ACC2VI29_9TREE|nr:hypothetical protein QFC21_004234 [Naganishia friedmannii]
MIAVKIASLVSWDPPEEYGTNGDPTAFVSLPLTSFSVMPLTCLPAESGFLIGRLLLSNLVEEFVAQIAPLGEDYRQDGITQLVLGYNSFGKPFLVQPKWQQYTIEFNITHDDKVVMLVAYIRPANHEGKAGVGIDIMRMNRSGVDAEGLEEVLIEQGAETARLNYLIRMWTAKEAYTKAIGTGLGTEFKGIALVGLDRLDIGESNGLSHALVRIKIGDDTAPTSLIVETATPEILTLAPPVTKDWSIAHGNLIIGSASQTDGKSFAWSVVAPGMSKNPTEPLEDVLKFVVVDTVDFEAMAVAKSCR